MLLNVVDLVQGYCKICPCAIMHLLFEVSEVVLLGGCIILIAFPSSLSQVLSHNLYTVLCIPHDPVALEEHFRDDDDGPVSSQGYMPYLNKYILDKVSFLPQRLYPLRCFRYAEGQTTWLVSWWATRFFRQMLFSKWPLP